MEVPLDDPLAITPVYWKQFVLYLGTVHSIANLYIETHTMLWAALSGLWWCTVQLAGIGP